MPANPLNPDQSTLVPPTASDTYSPGYPRAMYHPTKGQTFVADATSEASLIASDTQWTEVNPFPTT